MVEPQKFILVRYHRNNFNNVSLKYKAKWTIDNPAKSLTRWNNIQDKLFTNQIWQLQHFYPNCKIHLVTNDHELFHKDCTNHLVDGESNLILKLNVFGLLTEPAVYLDLDLLHLRPLTPEVLPKCIFNLYDCYSPEKSYFRPDIFPKILSQPLDIKPPIVQYLSHIIWINEPSKKISDAMLELHWKHFADKERMLYVGRSADGDELALSVYIKQHNLKMILNPNVGANRKQFTRIPSNEKIFMLHYTGTMQKALCIKEFQMRQSLL